MTVAVLGPDKRFCDVCEMDSPRKGIDLELEDASCLFICIVCLEKMSEVAAEAQGGEGQP